MKSPMRKVARAPQWHRFDSTDGCRRSSEIEFFDRGAVQVGNRMLSFAVKDGQSSILWDPE